MLAVASIARGEGRAGAARREPRRRKLQSDLVRVDVSAADLATCAGILDDDVVHRVATHVVVAAQIRACPEQAPQRPVIECG